MPTLQEEQESAEKTKKLHLSQNAKRLLDDPLLSIFFDKHTEECTEAFETLPIGATIEQYQTVHHDMLAIKRLKITLQRYIEDYDLTSAQENNINWPEGV